MNETRRHKNMWLFPTRHGEARLTAKEILVNDVVFPWESNPHRVRPWIIFNEYGAIGLVWASHEGDALDEAADQRLLESCRVDDGDFEEMSESEQEDLSPLGNASEPFDLTNINLVSFDPNSFSKELVALFAASREGGYDDLDKVM
jgi:hypothetical protein